MGASGSTTAPPALVMRDPISNEGGCAVLADLERGRAAAGDQRPAARRVDEDRPVVLAHHLDVEAVGQLGQQRVSLVDEPDQVALDAHVLTDARVERRDLLDRLIDRPGHVARLVERGGRGIGELTAGRRERVASAFAAPTSPCRSAAPVGAAAHERRGPS
jgi:hypothetical protein